MAAAALVLFLTPSVVSQQIA
ncbi:hypothetical protein [Paraburkholderia aspalathi]|nr:hypothetical protein [Paraburkholderia aspalathi]